jgi:hypothetical protein
LVIENVFKLLKPGGKFISIVVNPDIKKTDEIDTKYGRQFVLLSDDTKHED